MGVMRVEEQGTRESRVLGVGWGEVGREWQDGLWLQNVRWQRKRWSGGCRGGRRVWSAIAWHPRSSDGFDLRVIFRLHLRTVDLVAKLRGCGCKRDKKQRDEWRCHPNSSSEKKIFPKALKIGRICFTHGGSKECKIQARQGSLLSMGRGKRSEPG